jgi:hypothetical protein
MLAGHAAAQARALWLIRRATVLRTAGSQRVIDQAISSSIAHTSSPSRGNDRDRSEADKYHQLGRLRLDRPIPAPTQVTVKMSVS